MKVLLMVEREGRVVCASRNAANRPTWWARAMAKDGTTKLRYWLVEAESADEARVAIQYAKLIPGSAEFESMEDGHKSRILASGGRK